MLLPSGDQVGVEDAPRCGTLLNSEPFAFTTNNDPFRLKAMCAPSGDQVGITSPQGWDRQRASRRTRPVFTFVTYSEDSHDGRPGIHGDASWENTICFPFGDQESVDTNAP
jgi:hypothetical protein